MCLSDFILWIFFSDAVYSFIQSKVKSFSGKMSKKSKKSSTIDAPTRPIFDFFPNKSKQKESASDFYTKNLPQATASNNVCDQPIPTSTSNITDEKLLAENAILKLQLIDANAEITKLRIENKKISEDLASVKRLYNQTCRSYVQKDFKIKLLEKANETKKSTNGEPKVLYEQYEQILGAETLIKLRSVKGMKRNDSTFILQCMRQLYKDPKMVRLKSARGSGNVKSTISPDKRQLMENIFADRLSNEDIDEREFSVRYIRLNDLINSAINNIRRAVR